MRRRVEAAAKELNYVKSSAASSLKGKKRKIIAVLVPQFANQMFTELVLGVERVADRYGYILSICNTFDDPQRELEIIRRMQAQRVDGYIITPSKDGGKNTRQIRKIGVPMVVVDRLLNINEDYMAAEHLLKNGHRRIAFIGWKADFGGLERREQAYRTILEAYGVTGEDQIVYNGEFTEESGEELTARALAEHPEITAVLYAYNIQARGGVDFLSRKGIRVGEDLSVLIIGAPDWVQTGNNHYTCVDLNGTGMGIMAAEMLFDIINNDQPIAPYQRVQEATLKEGDSVCRL